MTNVHNLRVGGDMGIRVGVWAMVAGSVVGCRTPAPTPFIVRQPTPTVVPVSAELPWVTPAAVTIDLRALPKANPTPAPTAFRGLSESSCAGLAAANVAAANLLDGEGSVPCAATAAGRLRAELRYFAALELRNKAAGDALERYFQLADVEARAGVVREALPILDALGAKATRAKALGTEFPFEPADLARQRSQVASQLEQAEAGGRLLNIDLRHRLQLEPPSPGESLWPTDPAAMAEAAVATRAELRGLRALVAGLSSETLEDVRAHLHAANPLLGGRGVQAAIARSVVQKIAPDAAAVSAEVSVRRQQLSDWLANRERMIADETRAAAEALNAQTSRLALARDRADSWKVKLDDAVKQKAADLPGAQFAEVSVRLEWLKARGEVIAEVMAWHQARVKLSASRGALAPDPGGTGEVIPAGSPPPVVPWVSAVR
jgi:hypothetical protein